MPLLDSQKVELFETIKSDGFDVSDFKYDSYKFTQNINKRPYDRTANRFTYKPYSDYQFLVYRFLNGYSIKCTPHKDLYNFTDTVDIWNAVILRFQEWLLAIKKESAARNKWESFLKGDWSKKAGDLNAPFTVEEKKYLKAKLNELIGTVEKDNNFDDESKKKFIKEIEYSRSFVDTAPRKKDWFGALGFSLFEMFMHSPYYHIVQDYIGKLLIEYGNEFKILIEKL